MRAPTTWRRWCAALSVVVAVATAAGCGLVGSRPADDSPVADITVFSPRFRNGAPLPARYSCKGEGLTPPLRWSNVPSNVGALAVVVDDTDERSGSFVHWVVVNIDKHSTEISENNLPQGAIQVRNTDGQAGYRPPCRAEDNYRFTVYALGDQLRVEPGAALAPTLKMIGAETIARGRITASHIR